MGVKVAGDDGVAVGEQVGDGREEASGAAAGWRDVYIRQFDVSDFDKQGFDDLVGWGRRNGFNLEGFMDEKGNSATSVSISVFCDESVIRDIDFF